MTITITHTALTNLGDVAPLAAVTITEVDVYGDDVPASTHGPYSETAAADGTWSKAVDGGVTYRVDEALAGLGSDVRTFVDVPATAGPYDIDAILLILSAPANRAEPFGRAKQGSTVYAGIPGMQFTSTTNTDFVAGSDRFVPMYVRSPLTLTSAVFDVQVAPVSDANVRFGIYSADEDWQPIGAPLYDSGDIAVSSSFTGVKTTAISVPLLAGIYLTAFNLDVDMQIHVLRGSSLMGTPVEVTATTLSTLGGLLKVRAYGAFPTPASWDTVVTNVAAWEHLVLFTWDPA